MSKIIIRTDNSVNDKQAVKVVSTVIGQGKISGEGTASGKQYCYYTTFTNGITVSCIKRKSGTFTFYVRTSVPR